jgi:hypothetical protein
LDRAEDIILRRMEEGVEKWALRDFRREDDTSGTGVSRIQYRRQTNEPSLNFMATGGLLRNRFGGQAIAGVAALEDG